MSLTCVQNHRSLCLLDISADFDTVDHGVLITRLSSCSVSMALFSAVSSHICHLVASVTNVKPTCLPGTHPPAVSPKALSLVHYSSSCTPNSFQYPHFLLFPKPSPLRRWHSALSFLPSDSLRLQHRSPSQCSRWNFVMDDCKSSNTKLLQDWISALWSQ